MPGRLLHRRRRWVVALALALAVLAAAVFGLAEALIAPARREVGAPPPELEAVDLVLRTASGSKISGWLSRGQPGAGAILLVHGVRASRLVMIERARFLHRLGYAVVLIDLPAHGQSEGRRISYGALEAAAVEAALVRIACELPREKVGVIAVSLGAAAVVLSRPRPPPDAVVLESMFPTIREAFENRLQSRLGRVGNAVAPFFLRWLEWRVGVSATQLEPIGRIADIDAPVLIASGLEDRYTTEAETRSIFEAASEPKSLWLVPNAAHVDLHAASPAEYEQRVSGFLALHLRARPRSDVGKQRVGQGLQGERRTIG